MSTVAVNSDSLRTAGADLVTAREGFADSEYAKQLDGTGDHTKISPGRFAGGVAAEMRLTAHNRRMMEVFQNVQINFMALSCALHILADVYEDADHTDALEFAFAEAGANVPDGLPVWFDKDTTFMQAMEDNEDDGGDGGDDEDGGAEVTDPNAYTPMPEGYDRYTYNIPGYEGSPAQEVTVVRDENGEVVSRQYKDTYSTGATHYYTETYQDDGTTVRSDSVWIGSQGEPADYGDVMEWSIEEGNAYRDDPGRAPEPE